VDRDGGRRPRNGSGQTNGYKMKKKPEKIKVDLFEEVENNNLRNSVGAVKDLLPPGATKDSMSSTSESNQSTNKRSQAQPVVSMSYTMKGDNTSSAFVPGMPRRRYGVKMKSLIMQRVEELLFEPDHQDTGVRLFTITVNPEWTPDPATLYKRIKEEKIFKTLFQEKLYIKDYLFTIHFTDNGNFHFHGIIPQKALPNGYYNASTQDFQTNRPKRGSGYKKWLHYFDLKKCREFLRDKRIGEITWLSPRTTTFKGYLKIVNYLLADLFDNNAPLPLWVMESSGMHYYISAGCFHPLGIKNSNSQGKPKDFRPPRGSYGSRINNRSYLEKAADSDLKVDIFYNPHVAGKGKYQCRIWGYLPAIMKHFPGAVRHLRRNPNTDEEYPTYGFDSEESYMRCRDYHEHPDKIKEFQALKVKKLRALRERAKGSKFAIGIPMPSPEGGMTKPIYSPEVDEFAIYADLEDKHQDKE